MSVVAPVGRHDLLARAGAHLRTGGSVLVTGPAGAGRSTVVRALATGARESGERLLRCAPTGSEVDLPYVALIDLLSGVDDDQPWRRLPAPWRAALETIRQGTPPPVDGTRRLPIRLAALGLLRLLAERGPVLLIIDDLQWVDPASAEVLAFVARRVYGLPLHVVAAERVPEPAARARAELAGLCPPPVLELGLGPLSVGEIDELLRRHLGAGFAHSTTVRIHRASAGNPLFALELASALRRGPQPVAGDPLPVPDRLRSLMHARLAGLSTSTRETLLLVSAATRPTSALLHRAGRGQVAAEPADQRTDPLADQLAEAAGLGITEVGHGGVIRFSQPMLAATLYADADDDQRRQAHAALATATADPIERARHRALAATGPDESIAAGLLHAARMARRRGAPGVAAELALAAAQRTPVATTATGRLLRAGADALAAGQCEQARRTAELVLAEATSRRQRVRAWLVALDAMSQALPHADQVIIKALADAGRDPDLQARVRIRMAAKSFVEGRLTGALAEAGHACRLAATGGDGTTLVQALCLRATAELAMGLPELEHTLDRAEALASRGVAVPLYQGPRHLRARHHLNHDRFEAARAELGPLIALAERRGLVEDLVGLLFNLAEVELRAGRCTAARETAARGLDLVEDADLSAGPNLSVAALAEAAGGDPARGRELAARGVRVCEADGDQFFLSRNLHALGYAALVAGDPTAAAGTLHRVASIESAMGELDPALFRWHADLAEGLVADRRLAEADTVIARAGASAVRLRRPTVLASLQRARGLLLLARREASRAVGVLSEAAPALAGLPLEHARTLYALGVAERRRRRRTAAGAAFREALAVFERAGAGPWAARVRDELGHTDPVVVTGADGLTSTERRIAHLVTTGASNQQVATALSLSVKTIESYLTRIYRKLRIRSRAELAVAVTARGIKGFP